MRNINQAMSNRVKSSPEFANTRVNAGIFGHAQDWVNAYTRLFGLEGIKSGRKTLRNLVVQRLLSTLRLQPPFPGGQRILPESGWQVPIIQQIRNAEYNKDTDELLSLLTVEQTINEEENTNHVEFSFHLEADSFADWQNKGATHVHVLLYAYSLRARAYNPVNGDIYWGFDPRTGVYLPVDREQRSMLSIYLPIGNDRLVGGEYTFNGETEGRHPDNHWEFDAQERTFFLRFILTPTIGVRPNAKPLVGEGSSYVVTFGENINA